MVPAHNGRLFLPAYACPLLIIGGVQVLVGRGEAFRLGGLLALIGGLVLLAVIVAYVHRPARILDDDVPRNSGAPSTVPPPEPAQPTHWLPPRGS